MEVLGIELWQIALAGIICGIVVKLFFRVHHSTLPPRVPGIPLLGNINQVSVLSIGFDLTKLAEKYGDVFTISLYGRTIVAVNDTEMILGLMKNDVFANRFKSTYVQTVAFYHQKGIVLREWNLTLQHLRKTAMHSIMMVGEQRKQVEMLIQEEAESLVEILDAYNGKPVDPKLDIQISIMNVITVLCIGERFSRNDHDLYTLSKIMDLMIEITVAQFGLELDVFPVLRFLPVSSKKKLDIMKQLRDQFMNKYYKQLVDTFQEDSLRCMADHMIKSMYENPDGDIDQEVIKAVLLDTMVAGAATTTNTIYTAVAILVTHQGIQETIQQEIDTVIGRSQLPSMMHAGDMHYLQAFILELLRYAAVVPVSDRKSIKDTYIQDYFIPKGTMVMYNIFGCHHDPVIWNNPYCMDPGRFLDEKGHLVPTDHPNRKRLISFGGGRRVCIGEVFAKNRIFLFLSVLLQRFTFLPAEGEPVPVDDPRKSIPTTALQTPPYKIKMVKRD